MIEQALNKALQHAPTEKTFIDKLLAKEDITSIKELMKKDNLSRSELLELLYMVLSTESKLLNLGEYDRYILLKYFVWIREFIKITETHYDYEESLPPNTTTRTRQIIKNNKKILEHNAKFTIDLYLNIGRTSLSIGATGLLELLKSKFEIAYPQGTLNTPTNTDSTQQIKGNMKR